ncbi:MAG: Flp pilus assembly complex ATPase component TadA, partial [Candidatus Eremiobacteraeota bacterium]|nr:Flp pilus assembly complex ATPase component TadA [Candidatus Eremiobacteraeota bacterium]
MVVEPSGFSERLLLVLTSRGLLDSGQAEDLLEDSRKRRVLVEQVLVERQLLNRVQLTDALAESYDLPPFHLGRAPINPQAVALVPAEKAIEHQIVPVGFAGESLVLASCQPGTDFVRTFLEELTGRKIRYVISDRISLGRALAQYPGRKTQTTPVGRETRDILTEEPEEVTVADEPEAEAEPQWEPSAEEAEPEMVHEPEVAEAEPEVEPEVSVEEESDEVIDFAPRPQLQEPEESLSWDTSSDDESEPDLSLGSWEVDSGEDTGLDLDLSSLDTDFSDIDAMLSEAPRQEDFAPPVSEPEVAEEPVPMPEPEPEPEPEFAPPSRLRRESASGRPLSTPAVSMDDFAPEPVQTLPVIEEESPLLAGRYELASPLMECRFSTLYQATDRVLNQPVVLRKLEGSFPFLSGQDGQQPVHRQARLQILREGRTLNRLRHRNLPRVLGTFEAGNDVYLVLDEIRGKSLSEMMEANPGPLPVELLRRYAKQLLGVLRYLHEGEPPIIHRDLRPDTVLVTAHGLLKVGEFGLAKMLEEGAKSTGTAFRSHGDPSFAAPEQLMGDTSSIRNDLYSAGTILYYLATGVRPPDSKQRLYKQASMPELAELRPDCPPELVNVIEALSAPDPDNRPESARQALEMLDDKPKLMSMPSILIEMEEESAAAEAPAGEEHSDYDPGEMPADEESAAPERRSTIKKFSMWRLLFGKKDEDHLPEAESAPAEEHMASFPFVDLKDMPISREVGSTLSEGLCRTIQGVCIGKISDREITVACKDPSDVHIYDNIAMSTGNAFNTTLVRADKSMIEHALEFIFRSQHLGADASWGKFLEQKSLDSEVLETMSQSATVSFGDEALEGPIVEAVDRLIKEAISAGASDIHLEPFETGMDVRYRIDGVLRQVNRFSPNDMGGVVKRIKVLGNMDIAQERITQGGRISLRVGTREFDLRVSIVPVPVGESVVMRVLKKGAFTMTLSDLGFEPAREAKFREILSQPYGMILVCGPTGSGKSTTLYASLKEIARPDRKLLTVEDPIEYQMPGIIQVQVNNAPREDEKKVTFSRALREFLRQDPDVILVGEIRDQETAEIGIQAALTGHLLLSTIHTNDSVGIVARLRDMECEPFLIGSVLL